MSLDDAKIPKKSVLSVLLLYILTLSQWNEMYVKKAAIRNAALAWQLRLTTICGIVINAPSFSRTFQPHLQILKYFDLQIQLLLNFYQ